MEILERVMKAAKHEEPDKVPVALQCYSMVLKRYHRMLEKDYYKDVRVQLESYIAIQRRFPEVYFTILWPETVPLTIFVPVAFGGKWIEMEDSSPWAESPIKTPEDVDRLVSAGIPDIEEVPYVRQFLDGLRYFYDWYPRDLRDKYGYIDGDIVSPPLVEGAALTVGYDKFLVWMRLYPDVVHKLLKLVTEFLIKLFKAEEEIVGKAKKLFLPDHTPSMLNREQFNEFCLPYFNKIFDRYSGALRIWHNEGKCSKILDDVDKIHADVWHFGDDPAICKKKTHFCLMGNLEPAGVMLKGTPEEVEEQAKEVIYEAGEGGGLWLSTAGGLAPGTPFKNIEALIRACDKYGRYPLKRVVNK